MIARDDPNVHVREGTLVAYLFAVIRYTPHPQHTHARAYIPVCTSKQKK